jgi:hypothetical protein
MADDKLTSSQLLQLWGMLSERDQSRFVSEMCAAVIAAPPAPATRKRGRPKKEDVPGVDIRGVELRLWRAWEAFVADNPAATIRHDGARFTRQFGVKTSRKTLTSLLATGKKMDAASKRLDALLAEPISFITKDGAPARLGDLLAGPLSYIKVAQ